VKADALVRRDGGRLDATTTCLPQKGAKGEKIKFQPSAFSI